MMWTGRQLERITGGRLHGGADRCCTGVSTDTRTIQPGDLFVPIAGERFDGHDFIQRAVERECGGSLIGSGYAAELGERVCVEVPDTLVALGDLAREHLGSIPARVVGITGSNGKTSTKELVATALSAYGSVARNHGNFNNLIGLPLSAFQVTVAHDFAVLEMGMNRPGEIARLTEISGPAIGLITCIAAAHLEGLGTIDGVADAKGELFAGLGPDAVAVVNDRDVHVRRVAEAFPGRRIRVGDSASSDVAVAAIRRHGVAGLRAELTIRGRAGYLLELRALGEHEVWNAALAIGVLVALDLDPALGLSALARHRGVDGRLQWKVTADRVNIIDDTYNANPASTLAALRTLARVGRGARRIAVLGDMLELGPEGPALHEQTGRDAADLDVDLLFACGVLRNRILAGFDGEPTQTFDAEDASQLLPLLRAHVRAGDWVLVKGSRGMRMERLVSGLIGEVSP